MKIVQFFLLIAFLVLPISLLAQDQDHEEYDFDVELNYSVKNNILDFFSVNSFLYMGTDYEASFHEDYLDMKDYIRIRGHDILDRGEQQ